MSIKYWEFEDAPLKEKMKSLRVGEIAKIFFENETEAYRFGYLILKAKKSGGIRLKSIKGAMPISTAKRYLDFAVEVGILKHEGGVYSITDRFTRPLRNIATYIKAWSESDADEDIEIQFPNARRIEGQKAEETTSKPQNQPEPA